MVVGVAGRVLATGGGALPDARCVTSWQACSRLPVSLGLQANGAIDFSVHIVHNLANSPVGLAGKCFQELILGPSHIDVALPLAADSCIKLGRVGCAAAVDVCLHALGRHGVHKLALIAVCIDNLRAGAINLLDDPVALAQEIIALGEVRSG